ncbi:hypothetical protein, partial [Rhodoplanes roseus]|uniref:hypothetical protein n=1 Tax=Rhodoplanes roseus TaxID=29409 RepID=UPI001AECE4B3
RGALGRRLTGRLARTRRLTGRGTLPGALLLGRRGLRDHQGGRQGLHACETGQDGARQEQPLELLHSIPRYTL